MLGKWHLICQGNKENRGKNVELIRDQIFPLVCLQTILTLQKAVPLDLWAKINFLFSSEDVNLFPDLAPCTSVSALFRVLCQTRSIFLGFSFFRHVKFILSEQSLSHLFHR